MNCGGSSNALLLVLLSLQQYPAHGGVESALQAQTGCHATAGGGCVGTCDDGSACYTSKHGTCGCAGATPCEDIEFGSCNPGSCNFHQACQDGKGAFGGCGCVPTPAAASGPPPRPAPPTTNSSCPGAIPTCIAEVPNCMKCAGGEHGSSVFCLECCPGCTPVAKPPYTRCNCSGTSSDGEARGSET